MKYAAIFFLMPTTALAGGWAEPVYPPEPVCEQLLFWRICEPENPSPTREREDKDHARDIGEPDADKGTETPVEPAGPAEVEPPEVETRVPSAPPSQPAPPAPAKPAPERPDVDPPVDKTPPAKPEPPKKDKPPRDGGDKHPHKDKTKGKHHGK